MPSPRKEADSESAVSTSLLVAIADKRGRRESPYMRVVVLTRSTTDGPVGATLPQALESEPR